MCPLYFDGAVNYFNEMPLPSETDKLAAITNYIRFRVINYNFYKFNKISNLVIVLGKSGTGKSTSVKSLNPKETVIFNTLGKRLPFKGSNAVYNEANKNLFKIHDYTSIHLLILILLIRKLHM